jgi:predicted nucleotidyltransferase
LRLTPVEIDTILTEVSRSLGADARVWLYGSRLEDTARGGDVDLLLEVPSRPTLTQLAVLCGRLEDVLGLPCDVQVRVASEPPTAFQELVTQKAVRLEHAA